MALAKNKLSTFRFASAGVGSTSHLCGEMIKTAAKEEILHVPFRGPTPAKQAVLAGDVSLICDNLSNIIQDVQGGGDAQGHRIVRESATCSGAKCGDDT